MSNYNYAKMTQEELQELILLNSEDYEVSWRAIDYLSDPKAIGVVALTANDETVRYLVTTEKLEDQNTLKEIALKDSSDLVRASATRKVTDQKILRQIALRKDELWFVKIRAVERLTDQKTLMKVVLTAENLCWEFLWIIIERLTDQEILKQLAFNKKVNLDIRTAAKTRLAMLKG